MASQITSLTIVYSTVYSSADQRKRQSSASQVTAEFPAQIASNVENVSNWWRHHVNKLFLSIPILYLLSAKEFVPVITF